MRMIHLALFIALTLFAGTVAATAAETPDSFTVALIPDTQHCCNPAVGGTPEMYYQLTTWLKENAEKENLRFAIHLGDIVDNPDIRSQWIIADRAQKTLEWSVPNSVLPGNHDLGKRDFYNEFFGPKRFEGQPFYGGHRGDKNNNAYYFFEGGGMKFMVLCLQHNPDSEMLKWAGKVIEAHPDRRVIVATHSYLTMKGRNAEGNRIWEELIRSHPSVFMVVAGHVIGWHHQTSTNDAGGEVIEILSDYQWEPDGLSSSQVGGDGWLNTMKFVPAENKIYYKSYSPYLDQWRTTPLHQYTLDYKMSVETTSAPAAGQPAERRPATLVPQ